MGLHKISQEKMGPPQNMPSLWQKYSSIVARWVWWMACLPNPWSVSRWPSVSLSSNLQVSEAGAIHPYPSGATRGVSATNTLFQSILHSTLLAGAAHITNIYLVVPATNRSRHLSSRQLQLTDHPSPSLTGGIREKCSSTISFGLFPVSFNLTVVFQRGGFQGFPKCWDLSGTTLAIDTNYTRRGPTHGQGTKGSIFNSLRFLWFFYLDNFVKLWNWLQKYFFIQSYCSINMWYVLIVLMALGHS